MCNLLIYNQTITTITPSPPHTSLPPTPSTITPSPPLNHHSLPTTPLNHHSLPPHLPPLNHNSLPTPQSSLPPHHTPQPLLPPHHTPLSTTPLTLWIEKSDSLENGIKPSSVVCNLHLSTPTSWLRGKGPALLLHGNGGLLVKLNLVHIGMCLQRQCNVTRWVGVVLANIGLTHSTAHRTNHHSIALVHTALTTACSHHSSPQAKCGRDTPLIGWSDFGKRSNGSLISLLSTHPIKP